MLTLFTVASLLVMALRAAAGEKTDQVLLKNGDRLTGEIKSLETALVKFKTDSLETVMIEWEDIAQITSSRLFEVAMDSGLRYYGSLGEPAVQDTVAVVRDGLAMALPRDQVVRITPIERSFWDRFSGSLSVGFSYTKASDVLQYSLASDTRYRVQKNVVELYLSTIATLEKEEEDTHEEDFRLIYQRLLPKRWTALTVLGLQRNDELGIDRRLLSSVAGGRYVFQTNRMELLPFLGFLMNREWVAGDAPDSLSAEAVTGANFVVFIRDTPKTDLSIRLLLFEGLSTPGRLRGQHSVALTQEIIKDFSIELSGYLNHDNEPTSEGAGKADYGTIISLEWTY